MPDETTKKSYDELEPFQITLGNNTEPCGGQIENFRAFSFKKTRTNENREFNEIDLPTYSKEIKKIKIYVPYSDEPSPLILAIFATLVLTIERITNKYGNQNDVQIVLFNIGNILFDIPELKKAFLTHHLLLLPDQTDVTIKMILSVRNKEVRSLINNILLNVEWKTQKMPKELGKNTLFCSMSDPKTEQKFYNDGIIDKTSNDKIERITNNIPQIPDLRKKILLYSDKGATRPRISQFFNMAYHISKKNLDSKNDTLYLMILPQVNRDIIYNDMSKHFFDEEKKDEMHLEFDKCIIWFNEISILKDHPFFFNILSSQYTKTKNYIDDELYYAGMLDSLHCRLFLPYSGAETEHFNKYIVEKLINTYNFEFFNQNYNDFRIADSSDIINAIQNGFLEQQKMFIDQFKLII